MDVGSLITEIGTTESISEDELHAEDMYSIVLQLGPIHGIFTILELLNFENDLDCTPVSSEDRWIVLILEAFTDATVPEEPDNRDSNVDISHDGVGALQDQFFTVACVHKSLGFDGIEKGPCLRHMW